TCWRSGRSTTPARSRSRPRHRPRRTAPPVITGSTCRSADSERHRRHALRGQVGEDRAGPDDAEFGLHPPEIHPTTSLVDPVPAGGQQPYAFALGETAPHAVRLAGGQRVGGTFGPYGTAAAHGLGGDLTPQPRGSALAVGVKELCAVATAASAVTLPVPDVGGRSRQSAHV